MLKMVIDGKSIGDGQKPYIIAELSGNHNGSIERAIESISMAKKMGADAVKLQTYSPDTITIKSDSEDFLIKDGLWAGKTLYDLYAWAQTPFEWHKVLFDHAKKEEITCFSSPFDKTAVDLLEDLNAPAYKIASFEAIDLPLIKYVAQTRKPMIISTGIANLEEIEEAVSTAKENGCTELAVLHCVSSYPAPIEQSNILTIPDLRKRLGVIVGLSDHTMGTTVPIAAVALGAQIIEKHFTLSRKDKGPDSDFSMEPEELMSLCLETKNAFESLGVAGYEKKPVEIESAKYRRSLYVVENIKKGQKFDERNVRSIRPGFGLKPRFFDDVIGKVASVDIEKGTALEWKHIDD